VRRLVLLILIAGVAVLGGSSRLLGDLGSSGSGSGSRSRDAARVERVVDGDTLKVRLGGRSERVRIIGIDTPESVKPGTSPECGSKAAARAMRRRVGRTVVLVSDPTQDRRDRYDRLLRYVQSPGGTDLGRAQVRAGWAEVYVYDGHPFKRVSAYRAASRRAERAGAGVFGRCHGEFHRSQ
jgi:micrococcal nuclease